MFLLIFLLASYNSIASSSSILVDFSSHVIQPAPQAYLIEYSPPVGYPPSGSAVEGTTYYSLINGTISATEYSVSVSAIVMDGTRRNVAELSFFSKGKQKRQNSGIAGPDAPTLDSIETTEHEATISYFPPQGQNITYHIGKLKDLSTSLMIEVSEYYPEEHKEYSNAIDTKASLVRLRGLDSGTTFRLKIRSAYQGVFSQELIDTTFITQGTANYDYSSSAETYSVRTLPPNFNLGIQTTTEMTSYEYSKESEEETTVTTPLLAVTTTAPETVPASSTTSLVEETSTTSFLPVTTETVSSTTTEATTTTRKTTVKPFTTTTSGKPKAAPVEVNSGDLGSDHPTETTNALFDVEEMVQEYGEPSAVFMSDENEMLRLDWDVPENANCEAFFVNYTILSLSRPRSFSLATSDQHANIKMFSEHTLDIRVFCMLAGALSKTWWAQRIAHLSKPKQLENVRITEVSTDDFYVASIKLTWDWPVYHDFENYKIMISYGIGKAGTKEMEVTSKEDMVLLDKLEPSNTYSISIRNASTELSLTSKVTQLEQVTAPIISSTVYPGQISSNSININFGDSDPEQGRFDYYLLTFSGNNKNISKKVEMEHEKSFTFTKLIPGKTYHFSVYTVYKGVRSRPVSADITTYPLKVNQLFPVVGKDYVVLYWDIENFADSDCRFRLSYNADNIPTVSVELKGASRHRFSGLQAEVYYTFTITVIMGVGQAAAESESEMITVAIPKGRLSPSVHRQGSRELVVGFDNDLSVFSLLNGSPDNFAVIVSDDVTLNDDNYELKSWFEVKDEDVWGAYRASPSTWNPFDSERVRRAAFTVGTDDCVKRNLDEPYCNGILRASTEYRVKIRMYTDTKVAMETDWGRIEGEKNAEGDDEEEEEEEDDRRFPCHMYLNGCRRKVAISRFSVIPLAISLLLALIFW